LGPADRYAELCVQTTVFIETLNALGADVRWAVR
jgi:S-adenosylhomocysteine hydrolase